MSSPRASNYLKIKFRILFFLRAIQVSPGILDGTVMIRSEFVINMAGFQDQADMPVLKGMDWNAQKEK